MSKNLVVKISKRNNNGAEAWEGTVNLPGALPTKLAKSKTQESKFSTRSAVTAAAKNFATRYGFADVRFEGITDAKTTTKKSASKRPSSSKTRVSESNLSSVLS